MKLIIAPSGSGKTYWQRRQRFGVKDLDMHPDVQRLYRKVANRYGTEWWRSKKGIAYKDELFKLLAEKLRKDKSVYVSAEPNLPYEKAVLVLPSPRTIHERSVKRHKLEPWFPVWTLREAQLIVDDYAYGARVTNTPIARSFDAAFRLLTSSSE